MTKPGAENGQEEERTDSDAELTGQEEEPSIKRRQRAKSEPTPPRGFMGFSNSVRERSKSVGALIEKQKEQEEEELFKVERETPRVGVVLEDEQQPRPQARVDPSETSDLDSDTDQEEVLEQDAEVEHPHDQAAINVSTRKIFAQKGKVDFTELENNVVKRLAETNDRIEALKAATNDVNDIMNEKAYNVYDSKFSHDPFEAVGNLLKENKGNLSHTLDQIDFMARGAQRACMEENPLTEATKAKMLGLEQIQAVVQSMVALDQNNCRYSKVEMAKKIAIVNGMVDKTDISPESKAMFHMQFKSALEGQRYSERMVMDRNVLKEPFNKIMGRPSDINHVAKRGKHEFDTSTEMKASSQMSKSSFVKEKILNPGTASNYRTLKVSHSEEGKVVHLGFTFDRKKAVKGSESEVAILKKQVGEGLMIAMAEYGKGVQDNPIGITYRPPTIPQPETAMAMLESLKEKAVKEGKSFFVLDPNDSSKVVEFTAKASYSPSELDCMKKFGQDIDNVYKKDGFEIYLGKDTNEDNFKDKLNERIEKFAANTKENREEKDSKISKEFDSKAKAKM